MSRRNSGIAGALTRLGDAFGGALALGMALTGVFIHVDRTLNPGNPDAGQWGVLGAVIGLPLGFAVGWLVAPHKHVRRVMLDSRCPTPLSRGEQRDPVSGSHGLYADPEPDSAPRWQEESNTGAAG